MAELGATQLLIEDNSGENNSTNNNLATLLEILPESSVKNIFCSANELSEERMENLDDFNQANQVNKKGELINFNIQHRQQRAQPVDVMFV